ncbi:MAG: RNA polymerase sigma factor [Terriglobales bacterium]
MRAANGQRSAMFMDEVNKGQGWSPGAAPQEARPDAVAEAQLSADERVNAGVSSLAVKREGMYAPAGRQGSVRESSHGSAAIISGNPDDAEVMLRVKAGDDGAFNYLVEKYRRPMVSYMYRMAHNAAIAEELAQEVFLRVYRSRQSYSASAKFTTWLYRIATNLAVNHARDSRHERPEVTVSLDEPDPETGTTVDLADSRMSVEQSIVRRERLAAIRRHVEELPERQRVAVLMHKFQGMDYKQIGEVLKLSEAATKSLLFRAYETLREKLKDFV